MEKNVSRLKSKGISDVHLHWENGIVILSRKIVAIVLTKLGQQFIKS